MQLIASGGGYFENAVAGLSVSWTLGEVAYTTLSSTDYILTQGFQQGNLFTTSVDKLGITQNDITIYPNPARDYVKVKFEIPIASGKATFDLYDITGRKVISKVMNVEQSVPAELNLSEIRSGIYLIKVTLEKDNLNRIVKLVKE